MKQSVNFYTFVEAFRAAGRENQFSREALSAIFDYIENYEDASGEEIELDVIAICCDWTEASPEEINDDYLIGISIEEDLMDGVMEYLNDRTQAIELDNGNIVYVNF